MIDDTKKEEPKKKTLSLRKSISVEDIEKSSEKKVRGRIVSVEVVGRKRKEKDPIVNSAKLSETEIQKKKEILEKANQEKAEDVNVISSVQVVVKEHAPVLKEDDTKKEEKSVVESHSKETVLADKESAFAMQGMLEPVSYKQAPASVKHALPPKASETDKETQNYTEDKTAKTKKVTVPEKKKFNKSDILNIYVKSIDDFEENDEPELEEQTVTKEVKYTPTVKRKNKRNNIIKPKLVKTFRYTSNISVSQLALQLAEKAKVVITELKKVGVDATEDTMLDAESSELVTTELGHNFINSTTESIESKYLNFESKSENIKKRAPVVTIMGHVDHGKTTLLDTIRKASMATKEAGGITQHIGAYQVKTPSGDSITFLDTPGHEAFTQIRARGSQVTDIVILIVAVDDGVKPQTVEAINHAQAAGVPIIVAINKVDTPDKDSQRVKTELLQYNLIVEEMGGDVLCVEISAKNNIGIDKLLETIILQVEMMELTADYKAPVKGSIIEVKFEKGLGTLATILVQRGTLKVGDNFVCGSVIGKVKVMINDKGERVKEALPSTPVEISGFASPVTAGDIFLEVPNEMVANEIIQERIEKAKQAESSNDKVDLFSLDANNVKILPVVLKADTQGSIEAIASSLEKIKHDSVKVKVLHAGVGEINESDILLAKTFSGIVFGFNVRPNSKARQESKNEKVDLRYHSIIYNLIDDAKMMLSGLLDADIVENIIGYAEVREVFNITKVGMVAGCFVTEGMLRRSSYVRLLRDNIVVHEGVLSQLKRFKDDVKEVKSNFECGVSFENYNDIRIGDYIECYDKTEVKNSIE